MKTFQEWQTDVMHKVAEYDALISQKELELGAIKAIRDSYAVASYPYMEKKTYEAGMEDCGK